MSCSKAATAAWFLTETKVLLKLTKLAPLSDTAYHHAICADKNDRCVLGSKTSWTSKKD